MSNNFRAVQPLGDRVVLYNVHEFEKFLDDEIEKLQQDFEKLIAESN